MRRLLTLVSTLPGVQRLAHGLRQLPVRVPVHGFDGVSRRADLRLWFLTSVWTRLDALREESRQAYEAYDGGDVIDVGAYHGWYSVLLAPKARPGDRLVSLEPDGAAYGELARNLASLQAAFTSLSLWVVPEAAGDGTPTVRTDPTSSHPAFQSGGHAGGVHSLTVDGLVESAGLRPTFLKVDVEGAELAVLRGADATLRGHRPVLALEIHPRWQPDGGDPALVRSFVEERGYTLTLVDRQPHAERYLCRA